MRRVTVIKSTEDELDLTAVGSIAEFNSIRRSAMSYVSTLAIDIVNIRTNTTGCENEFIEHRLAMVPLKSDSVGKLLDSASCSCDGYCAKCSVVYEIDCTDRVSSCDMKCKWKEFLPARGNLRVMEFRRPGGRLVATAIARRGCGGDHAKWNPVSTFGIRVLHSVEVSSGILKNTVSGRGLLDSCERGVLIKLARGRPVDVEDIENPEWLCDGCMQCIATANKMNIGNGVRVKEREYPGGDRCVRIQVRGTGALNPSTVFARAIECMLLRVNEIQRELERLSRPRGTGRTF